MLWASASVYLYPSHISVIFMYIPGLLYFSIFSCIIKSHIPIHIRCFFQWFILTNGQQLYKIHRSVDHPRQHQLSLPISSGASRYTSVVPARRGCTVTEHRDLLQQSLPDMDVVSQSHAGGLPRQITPEDVDTRWPFRAGYPRLLRPSVVSIPIEDEAEKPISDTDLDRLKLRIIEILNSHNLPWCKSITPLPEVVYRR